MTKNTFLKLRSGASTLDIRLDRIKKFDDRSRNFPIQQLVGKKKYRSYSWGCNVVLNQGNEGACVGFSIAHELAARPAEVKQITKTFAKKKIYWEAQKIDEWEGGEYPGAIPKEDGTSLLAGIKVAHAMGYFNAYHWAFGIEDLIVGVGYQGPAILGLNWYEDMHNTDADGFIHPTGALTGGHCILCRAVNVKEQFFTLRNSWGKKWGISGDCYITFNDMETLLSQDGEAVFFSGRRSSPHKLF